MPKPRQGLKKKKKGVWRNITPKYLKTKEKHLFYKKLLMTKFSFAFLLNINVVNTEKHEIKYNIHTWIFSFIVIYIGNKIYRIFFFFELEKFILNLFEFIFQFDYRQFFWSYFPSKLFWTFIYKITRYLLSWQYLKMNY